MKPICRLHLLLLTVFCIIIGCTTLNRSVRLAKLDDISKTYEHLIRDSDFTAALEFTSPEVNRSNIDLTAYDGIEVVEYKVLKGRVTSDNNDVHQTTEMKYYRTDTLVVHTIQFEQLWRYSNEKKTWLLQTALPELK